MVRGQSIVRFTGTPVRLRAAAGVEIATLRQGRCVCTLWPGACQRGRLRHLFCDLDISARISHYLVYPVASRDCPFPAPTPAPSARRPVDAIRISGSPCLSTACRPPFPSSPNLLLARILAVEETACACTCAPPPSFILGLHIWMRRVGLDRGIGIAFSFFFF